jgi:hypothetical protein
MPVSKTNETIQLHIEVIQLFKAHWYYMQQILYYLKLCVLTTQSCLFTSEIRNAWIGWSRTMKGKGNNLGDPGVDGSIIQIKWRSNNRV